MKTEINPENSNRSAAFSMWMKSPMPMVTLVKTLDVKRLYKISKKRNMKFTMLMCWCVGKVANTIEEFLSLPEHGKLFKYDDIAINTIVVNKNGGINSCDLPFSEDVKQFEADYKRLTEEVAENCQSVFLPDAMIVGTSAMIQTELDCIVNQYTEEFANPMVMWGKIRKGVFKTTLPVSFQFHHVQMDGMQGAMFLENLQKTICSISI